jgi:predicted transglutaminase-like cysteine proteinase
MEQHLQQIIYYNWRDKMRILDWFKEQYKKVQVSDNKPIEDALFEANKKILEWEIQHEADRDYIANKKEVILQKNIEILDLKYDLTAIQKKLEEAMAKESAKDKELENYWNTKIPKTNLRYSARGKPMDVRKFFTDRNDKAPHYLAGTNDKRALYCLDYVAKKIKYTRDAHGENWQYANETMLLKAGDCEDGAILMANMMLKSGIPYWRIRLNAGDVKGGGHAYVTYLRESDNTWYVMDWCYWYQSSKDFKKTWTDAKNYFGIWFSWNTKYIFAKATLDRK